ncbi:hypothetical protein PABG_11805 [Paracoccidioides brasiliensis Pb03]|nr:hypothetical protein PABG_11805 [Paracoccidioides brasiliensis Pb03]
MRQRINRECELVDPDIVTIEASSDGKSLKLKFHWLPPRTTPSTNMTDITDFSLIGNRLIGDVLVDEELRLGDIKICNGRDGHIIRSGDVIELFHDPEKLPLPNWNLMEMQWVLQRLTVLGGAALYLMRVLMMMSPKIPRASGTPRLREMALPTKDCMKRVRNVTMKRTLPRSGVVGSITGLMRATNLGRKYQP